MASTGTSRPKNTPESTTDFFDHTEALSRVDGDTELLANLMDIFSTQAGPMLEAVRSAVSSNDPDKLEKAAHRLKGSVSIFGAHSVSQAAFELEKMGREGNLTQMTSGLSQLEQHMTNLQSALKQFRREL